MKAASRAVFHAGEDALQARTGMRERWAQIGPNMIRDAMPEQHREFFGQLPFLIAGSVDASGRPWASLLLGEPGFAAAATPGTLVVRGHRAVADPLNANLRDGAPLGLLGIQFETRRRNRLNGFVRDASDHGFTVEVSQSFGNCPKYIHPRRPQFVAEPAAFAAVHPVATEGKQLSDAARSLIARADTFFIASATTNDRGAYDAVHGVDVSHRGGPTGFVRLGEANAASTLTWPDFSGNFLFNTLGNLVRDARAGLLLLDFERGGLLALTGTTEIIWSGAELAEHPDAQRLLRFQVEQGYLLASGVPLRWLPVQAAR